MCYGTLALHILGVFESIHVQLTECNEVSQDIKECDYVKCSMIQYDLILCHRSAYTHPMNIPIHIYHIYFIYLSKTPFFVSICRIYLPLA